MNNGKSDKSTTTINSQNHWDAAYTKTPNEKLGWFEKDVAPTLNLMQASIIFGIFEL